MSLVTSSSSVFPRDQYAETRAEFERNVRSRPSRFTNMYNKVYAKTKSSYGRKKPISESKALATAKRHNFKVGVERVLQRRVEVKKAFYSQGNLNVSSYSQGVLMNVNSAIPYINIPQGTGQTNRIGNQIRTRKLTFSFVLAPLPYNAISNANPIPQEVVMMWGVVKNSRAIAPTNADFQKLFQDGNSSIAPTSNLLDCTRDINTDWFTVRKILRYKVGYASNTGTALDNNAQYFSNNDFKLNVMRRVDLTSICPKMLKFNDVTLQPTNDGLYFWVFAVPANGGTANNLAPVVLNWTANYGFEDA